MDILNYLNACYKKNNIKKKTITTRKLLKTKILLIQEQIFTIYLTIINKYLPVGW